MSRNDRKLLVLDLDETLIFASETPLHRPADYELPRLKAYLEQLRLVPNIRSVEKRGWRERIDQRKE